MPHPSQVMSALGCEGHTTAGCELGGELRAGHQESHQSVPGTGAGSSRPSRTAPSPLCLGAVEGWMASQGPQICSPSHRACVSPRLQHTDGVKEQPVPLCSAQGHEAVTGCTRCSGAQLAPHLSKVTGKSPLTNCNCCSVFRAGALLAIHQETPQLKAESNLMQASAPAPLNTAESQQQQTLS